MTKKTEPFLKWAGGKRLLLESILPQMPISGAETTYFEPFLGGGAVFFGLRPKRAVLSDVNPGLVETFICVRDNVKEVIALLTDMPYSKEFYYSTRTSRPKDALERAARFIYLNKTGFNGLYRENLRGDFNVPFGNHPSSIMVCNVGQLLAASEALAYAQIEFGDFASVASTARPGDIVYFDPPYTTAHTNNGFVEYNAKVFSWNDQRRLAAVSAELTERGVFVVVSNADHPSIEECYLATNALRSIRISRWSTIASRSSKRSRTTELLFVPKAG